jgi:CRAL/TRIO domain
MVIFKSLLIEFQRYYPELLDSCYVVNTPMFFQDIYDFEIKPIISKETAAKVIITGE